MEDNQKNVFVFVVILVILLCILFYFIFLNKSNAFGYKKYTNNNFYGCKKVNKAPNKDKGIYSNVNACLQDLVPPCMENEQIISTIIPILTKNDVNQVPAEALPQLAKDVLKKITFKDFIQQSPDKQYDLIFGIIGDWCPYMKVLLFKKLILLTFSNDLKAAVTEKIIDNYKASEFNKWTDDQFNQLVSSILAPIQPGPVIPVQLKRSF